MVETYLDCLLVPEIYLIPCFVKIVRAVLEIYESYDNRQTVKPIFYKVETYLDRLLVSEIYVKPKILKIIRAVFEIYESCFHGQTTRFFIRLRSV